jgi:hypothetical protein
MSDEKNYSRIAIILYRVLIIICAIIVVVAIIAIYFGG